MTRTVIITGGSSGIGKCLKKKYTKLGDKVIDFSRTNGFDITDKSQLKQFVKENIKEVDVFIHCAGYNCPIFVSDIKKDYEKWEKHYTVNFLSFVYLVSLLHDKMKPKGVIMALSSQSADLSREGWSGYCSSKAALNSFIKNYSKENDNIRIIGFSPSKVYTPMIKKLYPEITEKECLDPRTVADKIIDIINHDGLNGVIHSFVRD